MSIWSQKYSQKQLSFNSSTSSKIDDAPDKEDNKVYQKDRARIIHSASFRILQSKTQIIGMLSSDFYRTRLTHSMESAQIGSGIVEAIKSDASLDDEVLKYLPSSYLIEAICLGHDLGHPPFGHGGEKALNYMMLGAGGFESNAMSFRIATNLGEYKENFGLDLSRRALLGMVKYPVTYSDALNPDKTYREVINQPIDYEFHKLNINAYGPPKCIFDSDKSVLDWLLEPFDKKDIDLFLTIQPTQRHSKAQYRSLDNSIMDIADDIAYGVHDLEDAVALNIITKDDWVDFVEPSISASYTMTNNREDFSLKDIKDKLFSGVANQRKQAVSIMVNTLIGSCFLKTNHIFSHPLLKYNLALEQKHLNFLNLIKKFVSDFVIDLPKIRAQEYNGQQIILNIFSAFLHNPERLLPKEIVNNLKKQNLYTEDNIKRAIADHISSMSNLGAERAYAGLFLPSSSKDLFN